MTTRSRLNRGELLVSLALAALGIFVIMGTQSIPAGAGYSQIGPRAFPYLIGSGLLIIGGILTWQAVSGGWRNVPMDQEEHASPDWAAFALISAAVILHMVSIGWAGFILASTFLFILIARGFGSRRVVRDIVVGAVLSTAAFFIFTLGLGLKLPNGLLGGA
ncbi:MAG: putative tricarboxylic transport rane protein [Burkholderiales bacterium]|jgi:putative tricarboxylic transport membrane protein